MNLSIVLLLSVIVNRFSKILYKRESQVTKLNPLSDTEIPDVFFMVVIVNLIEIISKILT